MFFSDWLKKQKDRDDIIGDLASDAVHDSENPRGIREWRNRLKQLNACQEARIGLEEAWEEYKKIRTSSQK